MGIMFLHKLDILNRNLNVLFQKLKPVVTKLCAVTKLGDLTVPGRRKNIFEPSTATPNGDVAKEVRVTRHFFSIHPCLV